MFAASNERKANEDNQRALWFLLIDCKVLSMHQRSNLPDV